MQNHGLMTHIGSEYNLYGSFNLVTHKGERGTVCVNIMRCLVMSNW